MKTAMVYEINLKRVRYYSTLGSNGCSIFLAENIISTNSPENHVLYEGTKKQKISFGHVEAHAGQQELHNG